MALLLSATLATLGMVAFDLAYGSLLLLQIFPGGQQSALRPKGVSNGSIADGCGGIT